MPLTAAREFDSIKVGNTPLLDVSFAFPELGEKVKIVAKAEWANPGGSVKDRAGYFILKDALATGKLDGGRMLLDSSSGNTGIAYAWLGARLGVKVALAVPGSISKHRRAILQAYGAELVLTDPLEGSDGAIREVRLMMKAEPDRYWYADQYSNPMTWRAHYETTGPEIFGADRRQGHALRRGPRHERHLRRRGPAPARAEARRCGSSRWSPTAPCTASRASSTWRPRSSRRSTTTPWPTAASRSPRTTRRRRRARSARRAASCSGRRAARTWPPPSGSASTSRRRGARP